jgi:hypothetical protein
VPTYTVHEPYALSEDIDERATRLVFVKEGFALLAFAAPVIWLLLNRLWLTLILFLIVTAGVVGAVTYAGGNATAAAWASFVLNLIFGFEARNIHRAALSRKGYEVIGVVTGRDLEDAERRFLSEWLPNPGKPRFKPSKNRDAETRAISSDGSAAGGGMAAAGAG